VNTLKFLSWKFCGGIWAINGGIALGTQQFGTATVCFVASFLCFYIDNIKVAKA
jgi:hypothetical protein